MTEIVVVDHVTYMEINVQVFKLFCSYFINYLVKRCRMLEMDGGKPSTPPVGRVSYQRHTSRYFIHSLCFCIVSLCLSISFSDDYNTGVPNLWPAGQKWPAKLQKVALDLSKNKKKNINEKLQKLTVLQDIGLLK